MAQDKFLQIGIKAHVEIKVTAMDTVMRKPATLKLARMTDDGARHFDFHMSLDTNL